MSNEINLFGVIGSTEDGSGTTARQVKTQLSQVDSAEQLIVRIDSEGGSVFDGLSIYEAFASYPGPKKAVIESTAFSIASYIAMAFDEIEIAENGYVMIHEPSSYTEGTSSDLQKGAELLAKLDQSMVSAYSKKTGLSEDEARGLMQAETFMNASEALAMGFVNRINPTKVQTRMSPQAKHEKMPQRVYAALFGAGSGGETREPTKDKPMSDTQKTVAATVKEIKAAFPKAKSDFVLSCIERSLPLAQVQSEMMTETMTENEALQAKCGQLEANIAAMQTELAAAKAAMEIAVVPEEEKPVVPDANAAPTARGAKPVARATSGATSVSAKAQWDSLVDEKVKAGMARPKAVLALARTHEQLRQQMLTEANA